jgi:hypothetical protein
MFGDDDDFKWREREIWIWWECLKWLRCLVKRINGVFTFEVNTKKLI